MYELRDIMPAAFLILPHKSLKVHNKDSTNYYKKLNLRIKESIRIVRIISTLRKMSSLFLIPGALQAADQDASRSPRAAESPVKRMTRTSGRTIGTAMLTLACTR